MDKNEACTVLASELSSWRGKPYAYLAAAVGKSHHVERDGPSGTRYQLQIDIMWDHKANENVRVSGSIDDGGWRALAPLSDSFIVSTDGQFVD